ncbi:MAG: MIP/aquaporin family protein, partial [Methylophilaceae bacterium]
MIKKGSEALAKHWPEYLMEAAELAIFMLSACLFVALIELPSSPVRQAIDSIMLRHVLIGLSMGLTAIAIVYSPLGKHSGAHFNPAVTLTFLRLGKIAPWDAFFYIVAQFVGGIAGVKVASFLLGMVLIADPNVNYVVTLPGIPGVKWAFIAEMVISFFLMLMVLFISNNKRLNAYTPLFVGALITLYITFEAPISGMSMNPARTFGSALPAGIWTDIWIYFIAPPIGMLLAAETYLILKGRHAVLCCKLHHENNQPCIFHCRYGEYV